MTVFINSLLSLLFGALLNYQKKGISLIDQLIIFMVVSMFIMNISSVLWLNFHMIKYPSENEKFISFLVYRNILLPLMIIIYINFHETAHSLKEKYFALAAVVVAFLFLEYLSVGLKIIVYKNWNMFLSLVLFIGYIIISFTTLYVLRKHGKKGHP